MRGFRLEFFQFGSGISDHFFRGAGDEFLVSQSGFVTGDPFLEVGELFFQTGDFGIDINEIGERQTDHTGGDGLAGGGAASGSVKGGGIEFDIFGIEQTDKRIFL